MQFSEAGIILLTTRYSECVAFYGQILELPTLFQLEREDSTLTCFDLGGAYLMVEPGLAESDKGWRSPVKLRFNVEDVEASATALRGKGVEINVRHRNWGTTAEFADPDGNCCALRSVRGFGA